jgi:hypothetical protein
MKKMKILIILIILTFRVYAPTNPVLYIPAPDKIQPYEAIWKAICQAESGGDPYAIGDKNLRKHSYGIAQIRQSRLDDFYKQTGIRYSVKEMFDTAKSKEVFMFYASGDDETIARCWNGGPDGMNKKSTKKYYNLIKSNL